MIIVHIEPSINERDSTNDAEPQNVNATAIEINKGLSFFVISRAIVLKVAVMIVETPPATSNDRFFANKKVRTKHITPDDTPTKKMTNGLYFVAILLDSILLSIIFAIMSCFFGSVYQLSTKAHQLSL